MAELTRKKRIRAGHRSSATKTIAQVTEVLGAPEVGVSRLRQLKISLEEKMDVLRTLDQGILDAITEEDDLGEEIEQADDFRQKIQISLIDIELALASKGATRGSTPETHDHSPPPDHSTRTSPRVSPRPSPLPESGGHRTRGVRLPKLTLKKFNGDLTAWTTFWDSFESAIHNNSELNSIDKFNYLHSLLERSAAEAVSGLTLTAANYDEALAILKKRFGNKQQIVDKHMDTLLSLEAVSAHDLKGLRHLFDKVESHIRGLRSLGVPTSTYGSLLSSILMSKLPRELRLIVSRKAADGDWDLDALMKAINEEIDARERANTTLTPSNPPKKPLQKNTSAALVSSGDAVACCYCGQGHQSDLCKTVCDVDSRKQALRKTGRCYVCLKRHHIGRDCRSSMKCPNCDGRHHVSICQRKTEGDHHLTQTKLSQTTNALASAEVQTGTGGYSSTTVTCAEARVPVLLQTATVRVFQPGRPEMKKEVKVLFDCGSQRSYITDHLRDVLALPVENTEVMVIKTFGSKKEKTQRCDVVKLGLETKSGGKFELPFLTVPLICEPLAEQPLSYVIEACAHLSKLELADSSSRADISVLIGSDLYWQLVSGRTVQKENCPVAVETCFGWVLSGPVKELTGVESSTNVVTSHVMRIDACTIPAADSNLDAMLKGFWDLETLGIRGNEGSVYEEFSKKITFKENRYEVHLPWREPHPLLNDNYQLCLKRLKGLLKRLHQEPQLLSEYDQVIREQVSKGIVEVVDDPESSGVGKTHYVPHHAVIRRDKKTTKLRIVYDASAKSLGPSLNECLYTGPSFCQSIFDILLRFRAFPVALTGDIEKAFLMVAVAEEDRDVLRFLWVDDVKKEAPTVLTFRFARVMFGVSSSPFLLNATVNHHIELYRSSDPEFVERFLRSIYVDDVTFGASNDDEAYALYVNAKSRLAEGGFNLRKFTTSSEALRKRIEEKERESGKAKVPPVTEEDESYAKSTLGVHGETVSGEQKILGVRWNLAEDCLLVDVGSLAAVATELEPTKRNVIGMSTRIYDPIGLVSPCTVQFKLFFQQLCKEEIGWDDPLTGELLKTWRKLAANLRAARPISVPRCYFNEGTPVASCSLEGFCDASIRAYAAVVYMKLESDDGVRISFVASKTRVSPTNGQTIPRLELLAALLLARLLSSVSRALEPEVSLGKSTCYTDSKVVLYWITSPTGEWKQFVQNRVNEIRALVPTASWKHCRGQENPADIPSRGMSPADLQESSLWLNGPGWLSDSGVDAEVACLVDPPGECLTEMKTKTMTHGLLSSEGGVCVLNPQEYSSLRRLLRVTAYVRKFISILKLRISGSGTGTDHELTAKDVAGSLVHWVKSSQVSLPEEKNFDTWKFQLGLFCDREGLLRCGGRLSNADIPQSAKHPILLDAKHHLTSLIVRECHERVKHGGVKETLAELRANYWIVKGRSFIRRLLRQCVTCRRFLSMPYQGPVPPPLPDFRVMESPPFTYTGVDFAGPLYLRVTNQKVWVCLYTCCVVRAVHLEVVPDLSTQTFLQSFKRFSARRGFPRKMISDNAKTFKAAKGVLHTALNDPAVRQYFSDIRLEWIFNLEKAPWWGGFFERLVKSMKDCLKKTIGQSNLSFDELLTVTTEVEMTLNSRPISYVSTEDLDEPLTPSHFLTGRRLLNLPWMGIDTDPEDPNFEVNPSRVDLTKRLGHVNRVMDHFWKRWKREYLLELRESHRHYKATQNSGDQIAIGDIVLVCDPNHPRTFWKLAKIEELIRGSDERVRGACIRVGSKDGHSSILRRPLQLLYPLEVGSPSSEALVRDEIDDASRDPSSEKIDETPAPTERRPVRAAAMASQKNWRQELIHC